MLSESVILNLEISGINLMLHCIYRVDLQDSTIVVKQPNMLAVCTSDDVNMHKAMRQNYIDMEYKRFPMETYNEDSTDVILTQRICLRMTMYLRFQEEKESIYPKEKLENLILAR